MSIGGDIMTEHYENLIAGFLRKLEEMERRAGFYGSPDSVFLHVIDEYKDHFKNNGYYPKIQS